MTCAMIFSSDNGAANYKLCHCTSQSLLNLTLKNGTKANKQTQFGAILRLAIWNFDYFDHYGGFYYKVPSSALLTNTCSELHV